MSTFTKILCTFWALVFLAGGGVSAYFSLQMPERPNGLGFLSALCFFVAVIAAGLSVLED